MNETTALPVTDLKQNIISKLEALGGTSEEVANALRAKGVRGCRSKAEQCPVARYLMSEFPGANWFSVSAGCVICGHVDKWFAPPLPVSEFVTDFDCGQYRDMEER